MDNLCICSHALDYPLTTDKKQNLGDFKMKNTKDVQLIEQENKQVQTQTQNDSAALISVIERAATNPEVDIDKMERLLDMQERMLDRQAKAALNMSFKSAVSQIPAIEKAAKAHNSSYAKLEHINKAVKPILEKNGLALTYELTFNGNCVNVKAVLLHEQGARIESQFEAEFDKSGSKNPVQARASSVTYGKRHAMCALLNITLFEEDDDGFAAFRETISDMQADTLEKALEGDKTRIKKFCEYYKISEISELPAKSYTDALTKAKRK